MGNRASIQKIVGKPSASVRELAGVVSGFIRKLVMINPNKWLRECANAYPVEELVPEYRNKIGIHVGHGEASERDVASLIYALAVIQQWRREGGGTSALPAGEEAELNFAGFICADRIAPAIYLPADLVTFQAGAVLRALRMTPARRRSQRRRGRTASIGSIASIAIRIRAFASATRRNARGVLFLFRIISNRLRSECRARVRSESDTPDN